MDLLPRSLKRGADALRPSSASPPRKRRAQATPVEVVRIRPWDSSTAHPMDKTEVAATIRRTLVRSGQLNKHDLLHKYRPITKNEIRILRVDPSMTREHDIVVSLITVADQDVGPLGRWQYEALSYHWGPGPADRPIFISGSQPRFQGRFQEIARLKAAVDDHEKGVRIYVRPNLEKALRHLRLKDDFLYLWVDALCINQQDEEGEKPAQIAKMTQIYNKAENVCIWLGDGKGPENENRSHDFYAAMDFIKDILKTPNLEKCSKDPGKTKDWSNLLDLMRCSWFSRRWVIQELALAREATIHCGDKEVHWRDFADAIGILNLKFEEIRELFQQYGAGDKRISQNYKYVNQLEPLGAKVLVDAITNTFRRSPDLEKFEPVSTLEALVCNLALFESSDPKDTIFALLNIARESLTKRVTDERAVSPPRPNYKRSLLEVYTDFLEWVVYSEQSLDIICRQWAIPERTAVGKRENLMPLVHLPSWIQTVSISTWGTQEQGFHGRTNADSLVGKPGRRRYNASYSWHPEVQFGQRRPVPTPGIPFPDQTFPMPQRSNTAPASLTTLPSLNGDDSGDKAPERLRVQGIEIDTIGWIVGPVAEGVIRKECLERAGWDISHIRNTLERLPDKLWRTLVADRTAEGDNPPAWYYRAALVCMAETVLLNPNRHLDTREVLNRPADTRPPQIVVEYLKRVQAVTWNRTFIEGTPKSDKSESIFGLAPPDTTLNDRVCILFGCSVPCILRPCISEMGIESFQFIGEAYIYGKMDGEALSTLSTEEVEQQTKTFQMF